MKRFTLLLLIIFAFLLSQNSLLSQPASYTWSGGSGSWTSPTNWLPSRNTPATTDIIVINTSASISDLTTETIGQLQITGGATVSLSCTTAVTLTIGGGTGTDFEIAATCSLSVGTNVTIATTGSFLNNGRISGVGNAKLSLGGTDVIDIGIGSNTSIDMQIAGSRTISSAGAAVAGNWEVTEGTLTIPSGVTFRHNGVLTNSGTVTGAGTLQIEGGMSGTGQYSISTVFAREGSSDLHTSINITGNVTVNSGAAIRDWGSDVTLNVVGNFTNDGAVRNNEGSLTVIVDGDVVNNGTWESYSTSVEGTFTNNGTVQDDGSNTLTLTVNGSIVNNNTWNNTTTNLTGTGNLSGTADFNTELVVQSTGSVTVASSLASNGPITVKFEGKLAISEAKTLTAKNNVTVEKFYGVEGKIDTKQKAVNNLRHSSLNEDGKIDGPGALVFTGNYTTFENEGLVNAPTTFADNSDSLKYIIGSGGRWKSLTIEPMSHVIFSGYQGFVGAPTTFVVNGMVEFNPSTTISYQGTSTQTVAPIIYSQLEINNSAGASLPGDVAAFGKIETLVGNLTTGAYKATLQSYSTIDETGGSVVGEVYVVRPCTTDVNENFGGVGIELLPHAFTPFLPKAPTIQSRSFLPSPFNVTVTRITGTAPTKAGVKFIKRYYDLSATGYGLDATLEFHYRTDELNGANEANLQLYESTDGGATWIARGGTLDAAANEITVTGVNSLTRWSAGQDISTPAPTLTGVSPAAGEQGKTLNLTIAGANFVNGGTTVTFGGSGITVNSVTFNSATQVVVNVTISGSAATGSRSVSVTTAGGLATLTNAFQVQYPTPVLTRVSPEAGSRGENLSVVLTGTGFTGSQSTVSFGDDITVEDVSGSTTSLTVGIKISASATLGTRTVTVTNPSPGGGGAALVDAFSVVNPTPVISGITPSSGVKGKSRTVTITGRGFFSGVSSIDFGAGITVDSFFVVSSTEIRALAIISYAASCGARNISVTNAGPGGGTATQTVAFTISNPLPCVTALAPAAGARGKSVTTTITGTDFISDVTSIGLGAGISASSIIVTSPTKLTATLAISRDAALGTRVLTVTNVAPGGGSATISSAFSVQNPTPALASLAPNMGILGQTLDVVLTGTDFFSGTSAVDFGAGVTVNSAAVDTNGTHLTANITVSGTAAVGPRGVKVTNAAPGGGVVTLAGAFTVGYPAPTVSGVSPAEGGRGQTLNVSVAGSNFISGVTSAEFGLGITVNSVTVNSPTSLAAAITIDPGTITAARSVSVINATPGGGKATLSFVFNVVNLAPTIAGVSPAIGARGENANVTIVGTNFSAGSTTIDFGAGITVSSATVTSPTQMTANLAVAVGAALGARNIVVTNPPPGGGAATLTNGFLVGNPVPTVTAISPAAGFRGQSLTMNVTGTGFFAGTTSVALGPNVDVTSVTVISPTQLTAAVTVTPAAATGTRNVDVANPAPGGGTTALAGSFTITNPVPTIVSITPASALRGSAISVTVTGTQFLTGATSLNLGSDVSVSGLVVRSLTELQANIALASGVNAGTTDVSVTNASPGGGTATLSGGFTVTNPAPTVTSIAPASAGRGSLVNVTVLGTQFISGVSTASFGADITVTNTSVKSPTEMLVSISISSSATTGSRVVTVTNPLPGGGTATLSTGFAVSSGPATGIEGSLGLVPDEYALQEAYPNPFNPSTRIRYGIPEDSRVELVIHNMLGNVVAQLINGERSKGVYELLWHAENLPSGVYLIRLQAESVESTKRFLASRKVVLVK